MFPNDPYSTKRHSSPNIWTTSTAPPTTNMSSHFPASPMPPNRIMIPRVSISSCRPIFPHDETPPEKKSRLKPRRDPRGPLRRWCKITGWHGILDCYQADSMVARGFWASIVLVAALLGANQIFSMAYDYWSEDQWVTNMHFTDAGPGGLPMPNVTLCSLNMFNQSYMDYLNIEPSALMLARSQEQYSFYQQFLSPRMTLPNTDEYNRSIKADLARIGQFFARFPGRGKQLGVKQIMKNASHSCEASVLACGMTSDTSVESGAGCCVKNYFEGPDPCIHLRFNDASGETIYITSEATGVYLLLHPHLEDYNPIFLHDTLPAAGFKLTLSLTENAGSIPILVSPGTHNVIWMTLERRRTVSRRLWNVVQHLNRLKPPCTDDLKYKILEDIYYNPESCRQDCILQMSLSNCNCVVANGQAVKKAFTICNAEQSVTCGMQKLNNTNVDSQLRKCQSQCIEPCKYGRIKVLHNAAQFPAPAKATSFLRYVNRAVGVENFTLNDVRQLISVHLVYESMYIRSVEKFNRVSLDELVSNIGGALGVWTGISLISIIQVFAYLWHSGYRVVRNRSG